ncbi:hypothetical protein ME763_23145 [Streptomyces murinus]|uniref:hypothetical protein n=1 Tax=Streptomyces murinus TaxID=33900 RepID=UPI000A20016A|nr:hypothetical protein [Streptomyces murinus]WDO08305.1 hypothetical protein ME763_23145 [Streptomyces murinus]
MKPTTRGTLAAVLTGVAAAASATAPAAAAGAVPVPVPLQGVSHSLGTRMPEATLEMPLLTPGAPDGPRYVTGRLLPEPILPRLPITGTLPGADLRAPLPHPLGDRLGLDAPAADLHTAGPGLNLVAPLTAPDPDLFGLPAPRLPEAGLLAPALRTVAGGDLGVGPAR